MSININKELLRKTVRAVEKACGEDTINYLQEHHMETNNALPFLRGDFLNQNLRNFVVDDEIELIPFNRNGWSGRILHDKKDKKTYTVTTRRTLEAIPRKKGRTMPHYLQSILFVENGECRAPVKQMSLSDYAEMGFVSFDAEELESDFVKIMQGMVGKDDEYRHYVIVYEVEHREVTDISLMFLDKDFDVIEEYSLNEYLKPDFGRLTEAEVIDKNVHKEDKAQPLVSVKVGIRPKLRVVEKKA